MFNSVWHRGFFTGWVRVQSLRILVERKDLRVLICALWWIPSGHME